MSKTYQDLDRTKFPDAMDAFILFQDPNTSVDAELKEYEALLAARQYSAAANYLANHTELNPFVVSADRLNHILHSVIAMERFYMSDIQKMLGDIVTWRGKYNANTTYEKFDVVVVDPGSVIAYMAIHDEPFKGITPPHDGYWVRITLQGQPGTGLTYAGNWNNYTNYQTSNWVFHNEVIWVSTIADNLDHEPVEDSPYWFAIFRNIQHVVCSATQPENQYPGDLWLKNTDGKHVIKMLQSDGTYTDIFLDASVIKSSNGSSIEDFVASAISSAISKITPASIGAAPASHTHDDRYYTESEVNGLLNGKANSSHRHGAGEIDAGTLGSGVVATNSVDNNPRLRNIRIGSSDIGAGSSLTTGVFYFVYE